MRAGVVLLLMLLMLGCAGAPVKLPIDGPQTAAAVLALLPISTVTTIQGQARLDAYVGGDRRSVTLLVLASRADKVQFQALAPTLDLLGLVSSDGSRFVTFERGSDTCQTGLACQRNLMRFVPIPLPAAAMVAALLGDLRPLAVPADEQQLSWDATRHLYRLDLGRKDAWRQEFYVDPKSHLAVGAVWFMGARRVGSLQYQGDRTPATLPASLRIKVSDPDSDITIEYRAMQVNQPLDPSVFSVACPHGTREVNLPCTAPPSEGME